MAKIVVGLFDDLSEAQGAIQDLLNSGFRQEEISLTANDARGEYSHLNRSGDNSHADGSGAATGAGVGATIGGIGGLLAGLGALAIPGIGPIVAAGPIMATLAGAGIGAAAGGLVGALTDMGVPEEHAHYYAEGVRRGGALVTVHTDEARADTASAILQRHGVIDVDRRAAGWQERGWTGYNAQAQPLTHEEITRDRETYRSSAATTDTLQAGAQGEIRVPVTEEQLQVGKRQVERGGVRVYTHVREIPVQEQVQLREEHVTVDRRPVDRPVTAADAAAFTDRTIEVRETAEEAVVAKQARVAEEVVIRKDVDQRTETIQDTVRRTDVDVEPVARTTRTNVLDDDE